MNNRSWMHGLLLLGLCSFAVLGLAREAGIEIRNAELTGKNTQYILNAEINYRLSQVALDALRNGVYLQWTLQVKFYRQRRYIWDQKLADKKRRFRIRFHALMKLYQLTDLTHGTVDYYVTLAAALQAMSKVVNISLIERAAVQPDEQYFAIVEVRFDRDMLPVPLQLAALYEPEWLLSSKQYLCPLKK